MKNNYIAYQTKLRSIKFFKIVIVSLFIVLLLFLVAVILPEYLACKNATGNDNVYDIWGSEVYCGAENTALSESIMSLVTYWLIGLALVFAALQWYFIKLKRTIKANTN